MSTPVVFCLSEPDKICASYDKTLWARSDVLDIRWNSNLSTDWKKYILRTHLMVLLRETSQTQNSGSSTPDILITKSIRLPLPSKKGDENESDIILPVQIDCLVPDCSISNALAIDLLIPCCTYVNRILRPLVFQIMACRPFLTKPSPHQCSILWFRSLMFATFKWNYKKNRRKIIFCWWHNCFRNNQRNQDLLWKRFSF